MLLKRSLPLLAGFLVLALVTPAAAQTSGGIRGIVVDKDNQPLPGATVTVTNTSLGVSQGAVTDAKGEFRVVPLTPGKGYSVTVQFPSMSKVTLSDIEVTAGKVAAVPVTLRPDTELKERVRVVGTQEVVNTEQTTTQTNFSSEFIDSLPILGRDYQSVLTLAPGVSDTNGDGNPNIHGSRDTDVVTLVDGVSTSDPFTGKVGQQLNIDSIQEIEVKTSGATAEFSRAQGGFVNIVTKSGGNEFEGRFQFYWRSNILDGDGAGIDNPRLHGGIGEVGLRDLKFNDFLPFLSLAGPIRKDKAWYYFTAEYIQLQTPVNALTQAFVRGTKENRIFGKLSWDMSTNHKLVFTATVDPQDYTNQGLDSFTTIESGYTDHEGGVNLVLKETSVFNPNVFLETTVQNFKSNPKLIPTLKADTNHNGILYIDRNHDGLIEANERDPGEDYDRDGAWDVFEDLNRNGFLDKPDASLDPAKVGYGEDLDHDGHLTPTGAGQGIPEGGVIRSTGGCEGATREDFDCDGRLDPVNEDSNGDGRFEQGEDIDGDGYWDRGTDDHNHNNTIDDNPFPRAGQPEPLYSCDQFGNCVPAGSSNYYPYPHAQPIPGDRDYQQDQQTLRVSGPYLEDYNRDLGRVTLKQDLTVFIPSFHGQHDMKFGGVVERETFDQSRELRPELFPRARPAAANSRLSAIGVALPTANSAANSASNSTVGMYMQDTYKPLPNLTIGVGVRFDREAIDSFGYTPFNPVAERQLFNNLRNLVFEEPTPEDQYGNNDGVISLGLCSDPIIPANSCRTNTFKPAQDPNFVTDLLNLGNIAKSRLTQHHSATELTAAGLDALFPQDAHNPDGTINLDFLRSQGATFQEREPFRLTNNNLAPRLSVSWDPWGDSKTKLFANWSRFYDKLFLESVVGEEGPDTINRYYLLDTDGVTASGLPDNGIGTVITKAPPSATQIDRGLQTPFSDELTIGFERELAPEVGLRITYINRKYRLQLQDRDINHEVRYDANGVPLDSFGNLTPPSGGGSGIGGPAPDGRPDLYVQDFFFNQIFRLSNFNHSRYKGIEIAVTKRLSRKWQLDSSYTYSRAVGNAESFQSLLGDDPSSIAQQFGYLDFDQRHVVKFNMITFLPGDWQLGSALTWSSGLPYSIIDTTFSLDNFNYPQFRELFGRVIRTNTGPLFVPVRRNSQRNQAVYNIDVEAKKAFVLGKLNSKLFITVQNLLNTDDLTIFTYAPDSPDRGGALQLNSERRFGRRFEVGFQFDF